MSEWARLSSLHTDGKKDRRFDRLLAERQKLADGIKKKTEQKRLVSVPTLPEPTFPTPRPIAPGVTIDDDDAKLFESSSDGGYGSGLFDSDDDKLDKPTKTVQQVIEQIKNNPRRSAVVVPRPSVVPAPPSPIPADQMDSPPPSPKPPDQLLRETFEIVRREAMEREAARVRIQKRKERERQAEDSKAKSPLLYAREEQRRAQREERRRNNARAGGLQMPDAQALENELAELPDRFNDL